MDMLGRYLKLLNTFYKITAYPYCNSIEFILLRPFFVWPNSAVVTVTHMSEIGWLFVFVRMGSSKQRKGKRKRKRKRKGKGKGSVRVGHL